MPTKKNMPIMPAKKNTARVPKAKKPHVSNNSGDNEWYTPIEYIRAARRVMRTIDLDPASCEAANNIVGATRYFTKDDNGLGYAWAGKVWMNPPYSGDSIEAFTQKIALHYQRGEVTEAVVLVNNATDTVWYNGLARVAAMSCLVKGRISYWKPGGKRGKPLQGQAILYLGSNTEAFKNEFWRFGLIVRHITAREYFHGEEAT